MEQLPLKKADVLILASLTQTPTTNPDAMIGEFCVNAGKFVLYVSFDHVHIISSGVSIVIIICLKIIAFVILLIYSFAV